VHRARWVLPISAPPIENGFLRVVGQRIVEVGKATSGWNGSAATDWGDVALLPAWVNPHTHLEFSLLAEPLGASGISFAAWIRKVVADRRETACRGETWQAVEAGWRASRRAGVAALGEIATRPFHAPPERYTDLVGTVFFEAIGLRETAARAAWEEIGALIDRITPSVRQLEWGLSPHAPYSVRPDLFARLCRLAAARKLPLAFHLAESPEELELLAHGTGPLVAVLEEFDAWDARAIPPGTRPLDYLHCLVSLPRVLLIHGNYLDQRERRFLARHRRSMSVVYCPRTHEFFQHTAYPLEQMIHAGVHVVVGTDSKASSPDLSIAEELRCIRRRHPGIRDDLIVAMGTLEAARALGLSQRFGRLAPGFEARFLAADLANPRDPWSFW